MDGGVRKAPFSRRTGKNRVTDNRITACGRVFTSAMGVLSMFSDANVIAHNEISDLFQTGISIGWRWDYDEQVARDIQVENNHIFNLGQGVLSDMGGITLWASCPAPCYAATIFTTWSAAGTARAGSIWIKGSSNILVEGNVVCRVGESMSMHWVPLQRRPKQRVRLRRKAGSVSGARAAPPVGGLSPTGMRFERNIFLLKGEPAYSDYERSLESGELTSDLNLYWDVTVPEPLVYNFSPWKGGEVTFDWGYSGSDTDPNVRHFSLSEWQKTRQDRHSRVADPGFTDPGHGDFGLSLDSPAHEIGFLPINLSDIGPRRLEDRD
jgi:hypothetical protein